jgi:hypothetical protein
MRSAAAIPTGELRPKPTMAAATILSAVVRERAARSDVEQRGVHAGRYLERCIHVRSRFRSEQQPEHDAADHV